MNKLLKIFGWSAAGLALLIIAAVAAFALLFDPNALRDDITRLVEKQTGRQLTIEGDLSLSFYPWLGFDAGRTTLSNAEGFEGDVMARFESASASVKLMPLLKRQVELSEVRLDGVDLQLQVKADGSSNWDDLLALQEDDAAAEQSDENAFAAQGIGGVVLTNSQVRYDNAQTGDNYQASNLNLETGTLRPNEPVDVTASGDLVATAQQIEGPFEFTGSLALEDDGGVSISGPAMQIVARGEGVPGDSLTISVDAPTLAVSTDNVITLTSPVINLEGKGPGEPYKTLTAEVNGNDLVVNDTTVVMAKPIMALSLTSSSESYSAFAAKGGGEKLTLTDFDRIDLPGLIVAGSVQGVEMANGDMDYTVTGERLQGSLEYENIAIDATRANALGLKIFSRKIKVSKLFDDPVLEGQIEVEAFSPIKLLRRLGYDDIVTADPGALSASIVSGQMYYGPDSMGLSKMKASVDQTNVTGSVKMMASGEMRFDITADDVNLDRYRAPDAEGEEGEALGVEDIEIPVEALQALQLSGSLKVGRMQLVGLESTNVNVGIRANAGDIRVKPASAALYGGNYIGDIGLNVANRLPLLSLNERLENVQFGPLSRDLLDSNRITGTLNGRVTVIGEGLSANAITASANGDAEFKFTDGTYEGTDVWYSVRRARALVKGETPPAPPAEKRTRFANLSGTAKIIDGVMHTDNIDMKLPFMKVRGEGELQLLSQQLDFRLKGDVYDRPELDAGEQELVGFTIPIKITGEVSDPKVGPDFGGYLAELVKRKVQDKLFGSSRSGSSDATADGTTTAGEPAAAPATPKEAIEQKKEEIVEDLEDKLKDSLKGLFGGGSDDDGK